MVYLRCKKPNKQSELRNGETKSLNLKKQKRIIQFRIVLKGSTKEMEDGPMQNHEEPFHFNTCRYENGKIARVLCIAAGS